MLGEVNIIAKDMRQAFSDAVEGLALFVGPYDPGSEMGLFQNRAITESDLAYDGEIATALGDESTFFKILKAASQNAGSTWRALITTYDPVDGSANADQAVNALAGCLPHCYPEFVVFAESFDLATNIEEGDTTQDVTTLDFANTIFQSELSVAGKTTWAMAPIKTLPFQETDFQTFGDKINPIRSNVPNIALITDAVPEFIGAMAGRLVNPLATLADSPMRVATGPIQGLPTELLVPGTVPQLVPEMSVFGYLHSQGLAVPQIYEDFEGVYSSDLLFQTTTDSDYHVVENRRVRDKAIRLVRRQALKRIADRRLNNTPNSIAVNKNHFIKPLRAMATARTINGIQYPGDIQPPGDDAVQIVWESNVKVQIILSIKPYNSAKSIDVVVALDLTGDAGGPVPPMQ
jgi:hypothetical protein